MKTREKAILGLGAVAVAYLVFREAGLGKATLTVETEPMGGGVYLDGIYQGIAPITFKLDPGDYAVGFGEVEGYIAPGTTMVTLGEGDAVTLMGTYEPVLNTATLIITTTPFNAAFTLSYSGGSFQGTAPATLTLDLDVGTEYVIGFFDYEGYITPEPVELTLVAGGVVTATGEYESTQELPYCCWVCENVCFATFMELMIHMIAEHPEEWA